MTRKRICIVAAGLTLLIFGGLYLAFTILEQRDRVKSENMERIKWGMSKSEVVGLLGPADHAPGTLPMTPFGSLHSWIMEQEGWVWDSADGKRLWVTFDRESNANGMSIGSGHQRNRLIDRIQRRLHLN